MAGVAGKTNNPNGRPPKSKALTSMLEAALGKTRLYGGAKVSGKKILSDMVSDAIITGRLRFPNDTEDSIISVKDWLELVKWAYERIDGKPVQPIGGDENHGPIIVKLVGDD